ncbi:hypothetical protein AgCh_008500 [Apium graveolens]
MLAEGEKEFQNEMKVIGRSHHRNLVRLLGYSHDGPKKLWSARISDFGLAKLLKPDQKNTCTGIRGTRGYVAPEWYRKMPVAVKADVYSFGVGLLEIIFCRTKLDLSLREEAIVNELAKLVVDEETDKKQFERMERVGLWCILDDPSSVHP